VTLYASADRRHFYLLPEPHGLRSGDAEISTLAGRTARVDLAEAGAYEIPEAVAKVFAEQETARGVAELGDLQLRLGQLLGAAEQRLAGLASAAGLGNDPRAYAAKLGIDVEKDPDAALKQLAALGRALGQDVEKLVAGTIDAKDMLGKLDGLGSGGGTAESAVNSLLDAVRQPGTDPALAEAAAQLAELEKKLRG
jgi:hypothetical protein